jgi:hypothetical protein
MNRVQSGLTCIPLNVLLNKMAPSQWTAPESTPSHLLSYWVSSPFCVIHPEQGDCDVWYTRTLGQLRPDTTKPPELSVLCCTVLNAAKHEKIIQDKFITLWTWWWAFQEGFCFKKLLKLLANPETTQTPLTVRTLHAIPHLVQPFPSLKSDTSPCQVR